MVSTHAPLNHPEAHRWRAFSMVLAGGFMTLLDVSSVNVALPAIQGSLGANPSEIQWIVAGYSLTFALMLVPAGRLGDALGRRRMFLAGLVGFVLFALSCGLAPSAPVLATLRLFQGAFAGMMNPQIAAFIQELFQGRDRARAFGLFGMVLSVSTAIGPVLGGVLVTSIGVEHGWRAVFLINVPIGVVLIPLAARFLPAPPQRAGESGRSLHLDILGLVLIAGIVLSVMLPFVSVSSQPDGAAGSPWWLLVLAVALAGVLAVWERHRNARNKPAVLPRALTTNAGFVMGAILAAAFFAGFTSIFLVVSMFYQDGLGHSALVAGVAQLPFAAAAAIASHWSAKRVITHGRPIVIFGTLTMSAAVALIVIAALTLSPDVLEWTIPALLGIAGWGAGCVISPNQTLTLSDVPTPLAGTAAGLLQTSQRLGGVVGLTLLSTVYFAGIAGSPAELAYTRAFALSLSLTAALLLVATTIAIADSRRRAALG